MVALGLTGGHDQIVPLVFRITQQIFQFSDFVTAQGNTAQIIPLDPNIGAQFPADIRQAVHGRRKQTQRLFFKMIHRIILLILNRWTLSGFAGFSHTVADPGYSTGHGASPAGSPYRSRGQLHAEFAQNPGCIFSLWSRLRI